MTITIKYLEATTQTRFFDMKPCDRDQFSRVVFDRLFNRSYEQFLKPHMPHIDVAKANDLAYDLFVKHQGYLENFVVPENGLTEQQRALLTLYCRIFQNTENLLEFYTNTDNPLQQHSSGWKTLWTNNWLKDLGGFNF
jgi:hypothetical protein